VKDTPNDLLSTVTDISPGSKIKGLSKLSWARVRRRGKEERERGGTATQDGQPVQRDATGKTMLMNSRREETALEALTFALTDLYFLTKYFLTSGVTEDTADLSCLAKKLISLSIREHMKVEKGESKKNGQNGMKFVLSSTVVSCTKKEV